ncbi:MAG: polymer-forming cytoskeletal protein [Polyangiaceae bacterium]|nr:polymer-forming cytoskeletal protein [Polyangiaceae bacterium]
MPAAATELHALLGPGTRFEGKLAFEGRVRIDGTFRGAIQGGEALVIGEGADVEAEIDAMNVIVRGGRVSANVRATHAIELYVPAVVSGSLRAPQVFLDKGVQFSGTCEMTSEPAAPAWVPPGPGGPP